MARRRPLSTGDARTVAEDIRRRHAHRPRGTTPPALYGIYDRHSELAHKWLKACRGLDSTAMPVGEHYTVQSLLTRSVALVLTRDFPTRLVRLVETLARSNYRNLAPREMHYLRTAFMLSGVVGFALYHETTARLATNLRGLVAADAKQQVRHIAVADLHNECMHYVDSPFAELEERVLYRASECPDNDLPLLSVEGGLDLELALKIAADLANEKAFTHSARRALVAAGAA